MRNRDAPSRCGEHSISYNQQDSEKVWKLISHSQCMTPRRQSCLVLKSVSWNCHWDIILVHIAKSICFWQMCALPDLWFFPRFKTWKITSFHSIGKELQPHRSALPLLQPFDMSTLHHQQFMLGWTHSFLIVWPNTFQSGTSLISFLWHCSCLLDAVANAVVADSHLLAHLSSLVKDVDVNGKHFIMMTLHRACRKALGLFKLHKQNGSINLVCVLLLSCKLLL